MATSSAYAWDKVVKQKLIADVCVSGDLTYGVVHIDDQWFKVSVERIAPDEVDAFFPDARDKSMDNVNLG